MFWRPRLTVKIGQGKKGAWRWTARDADGQVVAVAPVKGYKTKGMATLMASRLLKARIEWENA